MKHSRTDYPKRCKDCGRWLTFKSAPAHSCFLAGEYGEVQRLERLAKKKTRTYTNEKYARYNVHGVKL